MPRTLMMVFSKPASPEVEAEYNDWYSNKHLPDLTRVPGVITATRYKLDKSATLMPGIEGDHRDYLAIYEIEGDTPEDCQKFAKSLLHALETGIADMHPALDMVDISASFAIPITEQLRAEGDAG
jgi:hypothetical protein